MKLSSSSQTCCLFRWFSSFSPLPSWQLFSDSVSRRTPVWCRGPPCAAPSFVQLDQLKRRPSRTAYNPETCADQFCLCRISISSGQLIPSTSKEGPKIDGEPASSWQKIGAWWPYSQHSPYIFDTWRAPQILDRVTEVWGRPHYFFCWYIFPWPWV